MNGDAREQYGAGGTSDPATTMNIKQTLSLNHSMQTMA